MPERGELSRQRSNGAVIWAPNPDGALIVWERPLPGCSYLVSVRPGGAKKLLGGRAERERSVVMVLRRGFFEESLNSQPSTLNSPWTPPRLVARLVPGTLLDPTPLADWAVRVAEWYGRCPMFVEVKDGAVCAKEVQKFGGDVFVRQVLDRTTNHTTEEIGWLSDKENARAAITALQNAVRQASVSVLRRDGASFTDGPGGLIMECQHCLAELRAFDDDGDGEAPAISHDDDVRCLAVGLYNIEAASRIHAHTRERHLPGDWR